MSGVSYFKNAKHFVANPTFNTYVSEGDALQYLHKHSATGAMHDSEERYPPPLCHPGTGEAVVGRIEAWYGFEVPPEKKIMWVFAPAGYGKTAIAGTVSKNLESRDDLDFNPARFIITLAYQFAMSIPELAPHIETAVKRNPMILNKALEVQLMKLIVEPFKSLGELDSMPHRLVIVDGLDECINSDQESRIEKHYAEDQERVQIRVLDLIYTLQSHGLPLCFLVVSRPEPWIKQHVEARRFQNVTEMLDLYEVGAHVKDVEIFVRDELARIAEGLDPKLGKGEQWPKEDLVQNLLGRTRGHMLYAATVIRHIDVPYDDPPQRLQDLLDGHEDSNPDLELSSPFSSLFELYHQIIRSCPPTNRVRMGEALEEIVVLDVGLQLVPFPSLDLLDRISGRAVGHGLRILRPLNAVMRLGDPGVSGELFFYHSSFPEFLKNHSPLGLDVQKGIGRLLKGCLEALPIASSDGQTDEVSQFALATWAVLWLSWRPTEADYICQLKRLLAVDLGACFVQDLTARTRNPWINMSLHRCINCLYHPDQSLPVAPIRDISPPISSPFIEEAVSHLRSSVERTFLHLLRPDVFASHYEPFAFDPYMEKLPAHGFLFLALSHYGTELALRHPTGFSSIARVLRTFRLEQEEYYELLKIETLERMRRIHMKPDRLSNLERMFDLAYQDDNDELQYTDNIPTSSA